MAQKTPTPAPTSRKNDQFYTNPNVAKACIELVKKHYGDHAFTQVIEPSAGTGSFSAQLEQGCIALDIDPKHPDIQKADFLKWKPQNTDGERLAIGNPPFGKNGRLASMFFNHAAEDADVVAFILPLSFEKASMQNRLDRRFHLVASLEIPDDAFTFDGAPRTVPAVFQIWERRDTLRPIENPPRTHQDFEFCKREVADFAVQRVGNNAGRIKNIGDAGSANSHYFIRATGSPELLRSRFEKIDFDLVRHKTAGNPSIAKTEVVALYQDLLQRPIIVPSSLLGKSV